MCAMYNRLDRVTIRDDLVIGQKYGEINFNSLMAKNKGISLGIKQVLSNSHKPTGGMVKEGYVLSGVGFVYSKEMFKETYLPRFEIGDEIIAKDCIGKNHLKPYNYSHYIGKKGVIRKRITKSGIWMHEITFEDDTIKSDFPYEMIELTSEKWVLTWKEKVNGKAFVVYKSRRMLFDKRQDADELINKLRLSENAVNIGIERCE